MRTAGLLGLTLALAAAAIAPVRADDMHVEPVTEYVNVNVRPWLTDAVIVEALKAQNAASAALDQKAIEALDKTWRAEAESNIHPTIDRLLAKPLSVFLRGRQDASEGAITEIFVTDLRGINAGASEVTSDLWQGDEAKFARALANDTGEVFVEAAETDESTQMVQSHASMKVLDEAGRTIGVITIGVNLDAL